MSIGNALSAVRCFSLGLATLVILMMLATTNAGHSERFRMEVDIVQLQADRTASNRRYLYAPIGGLQPWNQYIESGELIILCRSLLNDPPELFLLLNTQIAEALAHWTTYIGVSSISSSAGTPLRTPVGMDLQTSMEAFRFSWGQTGMSSLVPPATSLGTRFSPPVMVKVSIDDKFVGPFLEGDLIGVVIYNEADGQSEILLYLQYDLDELSREKLADGCVQ